MTDVTDIEDLIANLEIRSKIGPSGSIFESTQERSDTSFILDQSTINKIDTFIEENPDEDEDEDDNTPLLTKKNEKFSLYDIQKYMDNIEQVLDINFQQPVPMADLSPSVPRSTIHPSLQNLDTEGKQIPDEDQVPYVNLAEKYREWFRLRLKFLHKSKEIGLENPVPEAQHGCLVLQSETISYTSLDDGPVIYINGRTQYGESLFLRLYGFRPYFYMRVPSIWNRSILMDFMTQLSKRLYTRLWYSIRWSMEHVTDKEKDAHIRHRIKLMSGLLDESSVGGNGIPPNPFNTFQRPGGSGCKMVTSWTIVNGRGLEDYITKRDIEETDEFVKIELAVPELVKECKLLIMNHKGGSEGIYNKEMMDQSRSRTQSKTAQKKNKIQKNKIDSWVKIKSNKKHKSNETGSTESTTDVKISRKTIQPWMSKDLESMSPDRLYVYEANVDFVTRFMVDLNKNDTQNSVVNKRNMGHNPETCLYIQKEDYQNSVIKSLFDHDENGVPLYPSIDAPDEIIDPYIDKILESITPKDHSNIEGDLQSISSCDLEVITRWDSLYVPDISLRCYDRPYPRQVMSFDIESRPKDNGGFPTPEDDPVIDVCNILYNTEVPKVYDGVDMIMGRCSKEGHTIQQDDKYKLNSVSIACFRTEVEMLEGYHAFIHLIDPDMITGFNIERFDIVYLLKRAAELGVGIFKYLGRNLCQPSYSKRTLFESSARGAVESFFTYISGRQQLDVWKYTSNSQKLNEYNLDFVANKALELNKIDVHYSQIARLLKSPGGRRTLRVYCSFDALLSLLIMNFWEQYMATISMARVVGTTFQNVLERGQQFRIFTMLVRYTKQCRVMEIGPDKQKYKMPIYYVPVMYEDEKPSESYTGASVAQPNKGFYTDYIITQDFNYLYPSIMMSHNMCYCTSIPYKTAVAMGLELGKDFYSTPRFDISDDIENFEEIIDPEQPCFVYPHIQPGFLPMTLNDIISERKVANIEKGKHKKGSRMYINMDVKQLALKTVANSVYGFTGVGKRGMLPKKEIASAVTDTGRLMINKVRYTVKKEFIHNRGLNLTVLYGDTDSVMIIMHGYSIEEAEKIGVEMAAFMTKMFRPPICLGYEKLFIVAMFFKVKKKYIGIKKLLGNNELSIHKAGIDANRRDGIPYMNRVTESIIDNLLMKRDFNLMLSVLKQQISDFKMGKFNMMDIITTKKYSKTYESYTTLPLVPHLAKKMYNRDHNSAPKPGDRVPFVITKHPWKKIVERGEDPLYAYEHGLQIDTDHYIEKFMYEPIKRILDPIITDRHRADNPNTITLDELKAIFFGNEGIKLKQTISDSLGRAWIGFENTGRCFICNNTCSKINTVTGKSNILCDRCLSPSSSQQQQQEPYIMEVEGEDRKCFICEKMVSCSLIREVQQTSICTSCLYTNPVQATRKIIETNKERVDNNVQKHDADCMKCMKDDRELVEKCNSKQCKTFWMKRFELDKQKECNRVYDRYLSQFQSGDDSIWKDTAVITVPNNKPLTNNISLSIIRAPKNKKKPVVKKRKQETPPITTDQMEIETPMDTTVETQVNNDIIQPNPIKFNISRYLSSSVKKVKTEPDYTHE